MPLEEIDVSILKYRKEKRLSQADFAKIIGVKQATISNWESKKAAPTGENLTRVQEQLRNLESFHSRANDSENEVVLLKKLLAAKDEIIGYLKERINRTKESRQ